MVLRRLMVGLLVVWCVLGAVSTLAALTGPDVWWNQRGAPAHDVVGMPLRGAAETTAIRRLLAPVPRAAQERWLVVFPRQSDERVLLYIRYQLSHLEYPRRVDVANGEPSQSIITYAGVITAPGVHLTGPWRLTAEQGGFTAYVRASS
jgi:hypothetical protein